MASKNIILKRKIDGVIYDLFPKTLTSLVYNDEGKNLDEIIANFANLYAGKTEFTKLKTAFDTLTNGASETYDTLKEIGDWISKHNDAYEALLVTLSKKADKIKLTGYVTATDTDPGALQVVADDTEDGALTGTQIRQKDVIADLPGVQVGDYVKLESKATVGDILTLAADGGIQDSGYKVGGSTLEAEASEKVLATEKAVKDAIAKSSSVVVVEEPDVPEVEDMSETDLYMVVIVDKTPVVVSVKAYKDASAGQTGTLGNALEVVADDTADDVFDSATQIKLAAATVLVPTASVGSYIIVDTVTTTTVARAYSSDAGALKVVADDAPDFDALTQIKISEVTPYIAKITLGEYVTKEVNTETNVIA